MEFPNHYGRQPGSHGSRQPRGTPLQSVARFADFSRGYIPALGKQEVPEGASPFALNVEVTKGNRLRRAPGTTLMVDFEEHEPGLMAVHGSLDFTAELIFFDAPFIGVLGAGNTVEWEDKGLATDYSRYAWTNFGGTFIFTDGVKVYARQSNDGTNLTEETDIPVARSYVSWAGRLMAGAPIWDGQFEPMMMAWSAANSDYRDWSGEGASFELLIDEIAAGDRIICTRSMGLDFVAVLLRNSVWLGSRTGQISNPGEFRSRVSGIGAVNEGTCRATPKGIVFLTDDGVGLFDGGTDVANVSEQINNELLPLNYEEIDKYRASFDPTSSRYILHTPTETWVYEMNKQRWFKRDLLALDSVLRPEQTGGLAWEDAEGDWPSQGPLAWFDLTGGSEGKANLIFLGDNAFTETRTIEREDQESSKYFSNDFTGIWEFKASAQQLGNWLLTVKQFNLEVVGEADFEIWTPDIQGKYQQLIVGSFEKGELDIHEVHGFMTGRLAGMQLRLGPGFSEVAAVEVLAQMRGPRFPNSSPFEPPPDSGDKAMPVRNRMPVSLGGVVNCFDFEEEGGPLFSFSAACASPNTKKRWRPKKDGVPITVIETDEDELEYDFECGESWAGEDTEYPHGLLFVFAEKGMAGFGRTGLFDPRQTQGGRRSKGYGQERRSGGKGAEAIFGGHGGASGASGSDGGTVFGYSDTVISISNIDVVLSYPPCGEEEEPDCHDHCPTVQNQVTVLHVIKGAVNLADPNNAAYWGGINYQGLPLKTKDPDSSTPWVVPAKYSPIPVAMNGRFYQVEWDPCLGADCCPDGSEVPGSFSDCSTADVCRQLDMPLKNAASTVNGSYPPYPIWGQDGGPGDSRGAGGAGLPSGGVIGVSSSFPGSAVEPIDPTSFDPIINAGQHPVGVGGRGAVRFTYNAQWADGELVSVMYRPDVWNEDKEFNFDCSEEVVPGTPVTIECWGGGGSGGVGLLSSDQGTGGGGGAYSKTVFNNMTNQQLLIHVGAGGVATWDALLEEWIVQDGGDSWVKEVDDATAPEVDEICGELEMCLSVQPPEWEAEDKWTDEICKALN